MECVYRWVFDLIPIPIIITILIFVLITNQPAHNSQVDRPACVAWMSMVMGMVLRSNTDLQVSAVWSPCSIQNLGFFVQEKISNTQQHWSHTILQKWEWEPSLNSIIFSSKMQENSWKKYISSSGRVDALLSRVQFAVTLSMRQKAPSKGHCATFA